MSPIYVPGKVVLSKIQQYPAVLGEPWGGGYFAGYISHTANGVPTHALIVAPRETGATGYGYTLTTALAWKTANTATADTNSLFDGAANTAAMVAAGIADHPAAEFCVNLSIEGFTDWYLPSILELDIAYFNLKPDNTANNTSFGVNAYSVPERTLTFAAENPTQTYVTLFKSGGTQAFVADRHWSSYQPGPSGGRRLNFDTGFQFNNSKDNLAQAVRAFRRIAL